MAFSRNSISRLMLGSLADAPVNVRERMLASIPTSLLSLSFYSLTFLLISATAILISHSWWAWAWLGVSIALIFWRAIHPIINKRAGKPVPLVSIMCAAGATVITFGVGSAASVSVGNVTLTAMTVAGLMGIVAGLATRWAAVPRVAIAVMTCSVLPPIIVLILQGGLQVLAGASFAMVVLSIATFVIQNHRYLLGAISAEDLHRRIAQTDHLTGLANRVQLMARLEEACRLLPHVKTGRGRRFAVLYIDLDGFKYVNDSYGHAAGDELLQRVADGLLQVVGPDELVARIGGDEFIVLLGDADGLTARAVADEIIDTVSREHRLQDGRPARVGCTIGICLAPDQGREPEVLLARADTALYEAKNLGKGRSGIWRTLA
jgi:diguanylate cyclase